MDEKMNFPNEYKVNKIWSPPTKTYDEHFKDSFVVRGIAVDSGLIVIVDRNGRKVREYQKSYKVPNGIYRVFWNMNGNFGKVNGNGLLEITTGEMMISDPCYFDEFRDYAVWDNFAHSSLTGWVVLDKHGGDGVFTVHIKLKRL
jgi:hypothetical protein